MGENMNVLYISNLTGNLFAGPNNSVPAQIKAQSKRDNVFWYNINDIKREEWKEINCYNLKDYPSGRLKDLPKPFKKTRYCSYRRILLLPILQNNKGYK